MNVNVKTDKLEVHYPELSFHPLLQTLLKNLNLRTKEDVQQFLEVHLHDFEDPFHIFGMEQAAKVVTEAIGKKQKIAIHGDFDVDGISATTILFDYLYYICGIEVLPIIPHRVDEGYGLSEKTIQKAITWGANLIITVDCGIKDIVLVEKYKNVVDFVITDHHQFYIDDHGEIKLPEAKAVAHSAHPESKFSAMISGAATAWQLIRAIEKLRTNNLETLKNNEVQLSIDDLQLKDSEKLTQKYLDLVAMSTVCDIIPLTIENRKFVKRGCQQIGSSERIGLLELLKVSGIDPAKVDCFHFGFVLGPRLNAAARVTNDAMDALRLLSTKKRSQAIELAEKLNQLNVERKTLTQKYVELAEAKINPEKKAIVVLGEEWPEGILGLIAGKLAEKYFKPTFVASAGHNGKITGSSRSPLDSFYLSKALQYAKDALTRFGGHKQAAGFASERELFLGFEEKILEYVEHETNESDFKRSITIDVVLNNLNEITIPAIEELALLEPHGMGNPKPLFLFKNCEVIDFTKLGKEQTHLKLHLKIDNQFVEAIGFNSVETYYNDLHIGQIIQVIGHLGINEWNNKKKIQVELKQIIF